MQNTYIGIDPGADGALAVIQNNSLVFHCKFKDDSDACKIFSRLFLGTGKVIVAIEDLHAIFRARASSTFSLGRECGKWEGICCAQGIPLLKVQPKVWQRAVTLPPEKPPLPPYTKRMTKAQRLFVKKARDKIAKEHRAALKNESIRAANAHFPGHFITHDGVADAVNIAIYASRHL